MKKMIYAHRGSSYLAPENTISAFKLAIEQGTDGIEIDVHLSKDSKIVVIHDERIDRTSTGRGRIDSMTYDELNSYDYTCGFNQKFDDTGLPQLYQVLELVRDANIQLNIELKNNIVEYDDLEKKVIQEINRFNMKDNIILSSFNHCGLVRARAIDNIRTAVLYSSKIYDPGKYAKDIGAWAIHPVYTSVDDELIASVKKHSIVTNVWTVDDVKLMDKLIDMGVDGIITNRPNLML